MEGVAHRLPEIMVRGDVPHVHALFLGIDHGEHAVVGRHEMISIARSQNRPPRGADTGIDNDHVHRAVGKIRIRLRNGQSAVEHVKCLYGMGNVDNLGVGCDVENDSLDGANKVIISSKIGGKSDNRTLRQNVPSLEDEMVKTKESL